MKLFTKTVDIYQPLTIFTKSSILGLSRGSEYVCLVIITLCKIPLKTPVAESLLKLKFWLQTYNALVKKGFITFRESKFYIFNQSCSSEMSGRLPVR